MAKKKNKIVYAKKSALAPGELDPKQAKVLISIRLDGDVLMAVKAAASAKGESYQPMINDTLKRMFVEAREPDLSDDEKRKIRMILDRHPTQASFYASGGALFIEGPKLKTDQPK